MGLGRKLVEQRKAAIKAGDPAVDDSRDLITLMLKANMNPDLPESQRLSDEDVLSRTSLLSVNADF